MQWAMIADDLTGANDSGVHLAKDGHQTTVVMDVAAMENEHPEALVIDTDSRLLAPDQAYERVKRAAIYTKKRAAHIVFKKMDSTFRGNVGSELDAMYDVYTPDFVVLAPAFPDNGRTMRDGFYAVHGQPLHESDAARDPATPVYESYIPKLLQQQTKQQVHLFRTQDLQDEQRFIAQLTNCAAKQQRYLLFDAETTADLALCVKRMTQFGGRIVWAGSAGLAQVLSANHPIGSSEQGQNLVTRRRLPPLQHSTGPVVTVCGSVHSQTQRQLGYMLEFADTAPVEVRGEVLLEQLVRGATDEIERATKQLNKDYRAGKHVVLHTCAEAASIQATADVAKQYGLNQIGSTISTMLGEIIHKLIAGQQLQPSGLLLTGGDTARKVCQQLGLTSFQLTNELEPGIPIGTFNGSMMIRGVTKSGGFGTTQSMRTAIDKLEEEGT